LNLYAESCGVAGVCVDVLQQLTRFVCIPDSDEPVHQQGLVALASKEALGKVGAVHACVCLCVFASVCVRYEDGARTKGGVRGDDDHCMFVLRLPTNTGNEKIPHRGGGSNDQGRAVTDPEHKTHHLHVRERGLLSAFGGIWALLEVGEDVQDAVRGTDVRMRGSGSIKTTTASQDAPVQHDSNEPKEHDDVGVLRVHQKPNDGQPVEHACAPTLNTAPQFPQQRTRH